MIQPSMIPFERMAALMVKLTGDASMLDEPVRWVTKNPYESLHTTVRCSSFPRTRKTVVLYEPILGVTRRVCVECQVRALGKLTGTSIPILSYLLHLMLILEDSRRLLDRGNLTLDEAFQAFMFSSDEPDFLKVIRENPDNSLLLPGVHRIVNECQDVHHAALSILKTCEDAIIQRAASDLYSSHERWEGMLTTPEQLKTLGEVGTARVCVIRLYDAWQNSVTHPDSGEFPAQLERIVESFTPDTPFTLQSPARYRQWASSRDRTVEDLLAAWNLEYQVNLTRMSPRLVGLAVKPYEACCFLDVHEQAKSVFKVAGSVQNDTVFLKVPKVLASWLTRFTPDTVGYDSLVPIVQVIPWPSESILETVIVLWDPCDPLTGVYTRLDACLAAAQAL